GVPADDRVEPAVARRGGEVGPVLLERLATVGGGLRGDLAAGAQLGELGLQVRRAALLHGGEVAGLGEREQEDVEGEVGVPLRPHQGVGLLEDGPELTADRRGRRRTTRRGQRGHRLVGSGEHVRSAGPGGLEEGVALRGVQAHEGADEVGGSDLGVALGLGRSLGEGDRLGDLRRRLEVHAAPSRLAGCLLGSTGPGLSLFRSTLRWSRRAVRCNANHVQQDRYPMTITERASTELIDHESPADDLGLGATRRRAVLWGLGLLGLLVASVLTAVGAGAVPVPPGETARITAFHLFGTGDQTWTTARDAIVWDVRMPRALLAVGVGAGLAVCGMALQAMVRNVLADPYLLGVNSGASSGAAAAILFGAGAGAGAH